MARLQLPSSRDDGPMPKLRLPFERPHLKLVAAAPTDPGAAFARAFKRISDRKRFVCFKSFRDQDGKLKRVPYHPSRRDGDGKPLTASSTDPTTWATLEECRNAMAARRFKQIGVALGDLSQGSLLVGIDLDNCRNIHTGEIMPWATELVDGFATYTEVSPSGSGLKLLGLAAVGTILNRNKWQSNLAPANPPGTTTHEHGGVEAYIKSRFFVITEEHLPGTPNFLEQVDIPLHKFDRAAMLLSMRDLAKSPPCVIDPATVEIEYILPHDLERMIGSDPLLARLYFHGDRIDGSAITDRSAADYQLVRLARQRLALADHELLTLVRNFQYGQLNVEEPVIRNAKERRRREAGLLLAAGIIKRRIPYVAGSKNDAVDRICSHIGDVLFMRDTMPMRLYRRAADRPWELRPANDGYIGKLIESRVQLVKFQPERQQRRGNPFRWGEQNIDCTIELARRLRETLSDHSLPQIEAMAYVPILHHGKWITTPGYHGPTLTYLDITADLQQRLAELPEEPTREDANKAYQLIKHTFRGYDNRLDAAMSLAGVLTAIMRPSMEYAPMIGITGNQPGVGKGLLATALAHLCYPGKAHKFSPGANTQELVKRIESAIITADPAWTIDNVSNAINVPILASLLTGDTNKLRLFGFNDKHAEVTVRQLIMMTGNNLDLSYEINRRTFPLRIIDNSETPFKVVYEQDLLQDVTEQRSRLVVAGLTIVMAWLQAQREGNLPVPYLGSFQQWAKIVAGAVRWLTGTNPADHVELETAKSEEAMHRRRIWHGLLNAFEQRKFSSMAAGKQGARRDGTNVLWGEILESTKIDKQTGHAEARAVGVWLRKHMDVTVAGHKLTQLKKTSAVGVQWYFIPLVTQEDLKAAAEQE